LAHLPLFNHITDSEDPSLPLFSFRSQWLDKSRSKDHIDIGKRLIKNSEDIIELGKNWALSFLICFDCESGGFPSVLQKLQISSKFIFLDSLD
jgi:hypothetical protein